MGLEDNFKYHPAKSAPFTKAVHGLLCMPQIYYTSVTENSCGSNDSYSYGADSKAANSCNIPFEDHLPLYASKSYNCFL